MLQIRTTGVEDFIDGSANIKSLIIGGPGAGKTRMSSYWPKPIYLDCENGRGSLADRNMPYVEIKTSRDMLDALEYLKTLERTAKAERQFQTVVVDTADSFQRVVKDEWVRDTKAGSFTGYDAWGYLDTKMQLLFTRLLNLDYNVIVLVHYTSKEHKDGDNTVREFALQLQGAVKDQVFNDFGLVGWLGTYWAAGEEGRVQKRGLTFQPTPDKPFLKDRFNVTPKWLEINFSDADYRQLFEAFFNRPEFEALPEGDVVGEIPDAETVARQAPPGVTRPAEGGPLPPRPPVDPPLDKMLKGELEDIAKELGVPFRGNTLKGELVEAIKAKRLELSQPTEKPELHNGITNELTPPPAEESLVDKPRSGEESLVDKPRSGFTVGGGQFDASDAMQSIRQAQDKAAAPDPLSPPSSAESSTVEDAPAADASSEPSLLTVEEVADRLGGEVLDVEKHDTALTNVQGGTPETPAVPPGPQACADCNTSLAEKWATPTGRDFIRLSRAKHKRYLCASCHRTASGK